MDELNDLLTRTAPTPTRRVSAAEVRAEVARRDRRRQVMTGALAVVVVLAVSGTLWTAWDPAAPVSVATAPATAAPSTAAAATAPEVTPATTTPAVPVTAAPTPTVPAAAVPAATAPALVDPPAEWVGLSQDGDVLVVDAGGTSDRTVLGRGAVTGDGSGTTPVDLALATHGPLVGELSEPVSGTIRGVADGGLPPLADEQGLLVDAHPAGGRITADTFGYWRWNGDDETRDGAIDVAVDGAGTAVALIDPSRTAVVDPASTETGLQVLGTAGARFIPLDTSPWCRVALLDGQQVLLLRGSEQRWVEACTIDGADLLDLRTGATTALDLGLADAPARHVGVDASGTHLILTGVDGSVRWTTAGGGGGELAPAGYVAADW